MTGEKQRPASPQPGGRPPAPGDLALVQAFVNSHYDLEHEHGAELLATPADAGRWLAAHGLVGDASRINRAGLELLLRVREALRELARSPDAAGASAARHVLNAAAAGAPVELRFEPQGPRFVAEQGKAVSGAVALLLAITARAMLDGSWERLKVCPGDDCGWAFYDHSRNRSGRWCAMSVCGGRAKARAHYRRTREVEPGR